jgi:hypothetical protein
MEALGFTGKKVERDDLSGFGTAREGKQRSTGRSVGGVGLQRLAGVGSDIEWFGRFGSGL